MDLTNYEDSDRPGDVVSIEQANRAAIVSWWAGFRLGVMVGGVSAIVFGVMGWWLR